MGTSTEEPLFMMITSSKLLENAYIYIYTYWIIAHTSSSMSNWQWSSFTPTAWAQQALEATTCPVFIPYATLLLAGVHATTTQTSQTTMQHGRLVPTHCMGALQQQLHPRYACTLPGGSAAQTYHGCLAHAAGLTPRKGLDRVVGEFFPRAAARAVCRCHSQIEDSWLCGAADADQHNMSHAATRIYQSLPQSMLVV